MNEIINKIERLKASGFEPVAVLMTQSFYNDLTGSQHLATSESVRRYSYPNIFYDLPIRIKNSSDLLYSIEVA